MKFVKIHKNKVILIASIFAAIGAYPVIMDICSQLFGWFNLFFINCNLIMAGKHKIIYTIMTTILMAQSVIVYQSYHWFIEDPLSPADI